MIYPRISVFMNEARGIFSFPRLSLCWALNLLNVLIHKFVCKNLFISPIATPLLSPGGWYKFACIYACLLVGLMYVSTSNVIVVKKLGPL